DEKGAPILCCVVIEHVDGAGVPDRVGDVPLSKETRASFFLEGKCRMEQLDGHLGAISVGRFVDARHPAYTDHPVEVPLAAQSSTNPPLGLFDDSWCKHGKFPGPMRGSQRAGATLQQLADDPSHAVVGL